MAVTYQVLNPTAIQALLRGPQGAVARDLYRRGLRVESAAKQNISGRGGPKRVDTGRLRSTIHTQLIVRNGQPAVIVGTNVRYGRYVHDGTGIYGPLHRPIRPRRAKFLRFKPKDAKRYVYVRQVAGMRPNRFLHNALRAAKA